MKWRLAFVGFRAGWCWRVLVGTDGVLTACVRLWLVVQGLALLLWMK